MKIKVISLRSSRRRRESIERQFQKLDIAFDFFDAVEPTESMEFIRGYDEDEFIVNCGRPATDGEIACYASHLALWQACAQEREPFLVLEDDAQLDDDFPTGLLVTISQIQKLGFIRVSLPALKTSAKIGRLGPYDIHYCMRAPLLALGYAISPVVAERLATIGDLVEEPVDKFLQRFWRFRQPVFAVVPPFVSLSRHADESDIGSRKKRAADTSVWLRRAARKAQNAVSRSLYNAAFLGSVT